MAKELETIESRVQKVDRECDKLKNDLLREQGKRRGRKRRGRGRIKRDGNILKR